MIVQPTEISHMSSSEETAVDVQGLQYILLLAIIDKLMQLCQQFQQIIDKMY